MAIQASYEGLLQEDITSTATGAITFQVSPALTNADGVLKVSIGTDREEWFEVTGVNVGNSTITTSTRGLSLTATATLTEVAENRLQHFAGEKISIVTFPNSIHTQNTDTGTTSTSFKINTGGNEADLQTTGLTGDRDYTLFDRDGKLADTTYVAETIVAIGSGDVAGPASSTDNAITRFDSTTGKIIQNSGATISDDNTIETTITGSTNNGIVLNDNRSTSDFGGLWINNTGAGRAAYFDVSSATHDRENIYATTGQTLSSAFDRTYSAYNFTYTSTNSDTANASTISAPMVNISRSVIHSAGGAGATTISEPTVKISNTTTGTAVVDNTPVLEIEQARTISTNFKKIQDLAGVDIYVSDGTTPNGNLSGTAGDVCYNGPSGQPFYCTGTTNWTGM